MSGLINKVKEAVKSDKHGEAGHTHGESGHSHTEGTHRTHPTEGISSHESAAPRTTGTGAYTGQYETGGLGDTTQHKPTTGTTGGLGSGYSEGTGGTQREVGSGFGSHTGGTGTGATETGGFGSTGKESGLGGTSGGTSGLRETGTRSGATGYDDPAGTHGPHSSRAGNVADPRVDSDRDNRGTGQTGGLGSTGNTGHSSGLGSSGTTGHTGGLGQSGQTTGTGFGSGTGRTGYDDPAGTHGPHGSRAGNVADPRVDSDRDNRGAAYETSAGGAAGGLGTASGQGPAPQTAGPHKSDMFNKVDPRVDSNLDGSKTFGGDKTYQS